MSSWCSEPQYYAVVENAMWTIWRCKHFPLGLKHKGHVLYVCYPWITITIISFQMIILCRETCLFVLQKWIKLKELQKKRKGWKKKSWPQLQEDVQLLFSLIDAKVLSRTLRMVRISKEQLFWCEEKMKKLDLVDGKLWRDPSPTLFPCP